MAALDVFGVDLSGKSFSQFRILDIYNPRTKWTSQMMVSPLVTFPVSCYPTIVVGDFIIHYRLRDTLYSHSAEG